MNTSSGNSTNRYAHDVVLTSVRRRSNVMDVVWMSKRCRVLTGNVLKIDFLKLEDCEIMKDEQNSFLDFCARHNSHDYVSLALDYKISTKNIFICRQICRQSLYSRYIAINKLIYDLLLNSANIYNSITIFLQIHF